MKVSELEGKWLDYWTARALGLPLCEEWDQETYIMVGTGRGDLETFSPSSEWHVAGPIIEREEIGFHPMSDGKQWLATDYQIRQPHAYGQGPTPLIAAMRCYVALKFGEEVPDQESQ